MSINVHLLVGGIPMEKVNTPDLPRSHIIVGTPGRILDMFQRRFISSDHFSMIVIDEADELFLRGFSDQIYEIYEFYLPKTIQSVIVSKTMPRDIKELTKKYDIPLHSMFIKKYELSHRIKHFYIAVEKEEWKLDTLRDLYDTCLNSKRVVIYCDFIHKVEWLAAKLEEHQCQVGAFVTELNANEREKMLSEFHCGSRPIIITTTIHADSIELQNTTCIIKYDLPVDHKSYSLGLEIHGHCFMTVLNFVTQDEFSMLRNIERLYDIQISELPAHGF
jgi:superfamily II DNA/RNA helicase